jgi:hypothetical protein
MNAPPSSDIALQLLATALFAIPVVIGTGVPAQAQPTACIGDTGGITLSPGFCATVFADKLGHARHLVVTPVPSTVMCQKQKSTKALCRRWAVRGFPQPM